MGKVRFENTMLSLEGVEYRINIWDSDYTGTTVTNLRHHGFTIDYDRVSSPLEPLIPSTCTYMLEDDGSTAFNLFKTDLANAQEDEFKLYIEKKVSGSWVIYWAGIIMSDLVTWDNISTPRPFEIRAKCGLNRLSGIRFDKILSSPYTSDPLQPISKIVFDCLSYVGTAQFWDGSTKPYIAASCQRRDAQQTGITQAKILGLIRIGKEFLIDDSGKPDGGSKNYTFRGKDDPPLKTKDILTQILRLFGLRIYLNDGSWHIQQVGSMGLDTYTQGEYDYIGTYTGSNTHTTKLVANTTTLRPLGGGKFGYYPPVKLARAKVFPSDILNGSFYLAGSVNKDNLTFIGSTFSLGTLYGGTGLQLQINVYFDLKDWNANIGKDYYVEVGVKLVMGSYRIRQSITDAGYKGGDCSFTTTSTDMYYYDIRYPLSTNYFQNVGQVVNIKTPDLPSGTYANSTLVVIATLKSIKGSTTFPPVKEKNIWMNRVDITLVDTTKNSFAQITELESESPFTSANSIDIDYGFLRISDNIGQTSISDFNSVMVAAPNDGSGLERSGNWIAGYTSNESLVKTLLKETIALQKTSVKKYLGGFNGIAYQCHNTISYDGVEWMFMGGRFDSNLDTWDADFFAIAIDYTVATTSTNRGYDTPSSRTVPPRGYSTTYDPTKSNSVGNVPLTEMNTIIDIGDVITTLDVDSVAFRLIRKGDKIQVLNGNTMLPYQSFNVATDVEIGDTTIAIDSDTVDITAYQGAIVAHNPREITASEIIRGYNLQISKTYELGTGVGINKTYILKAFTTNNIPKELTTDGNIPSGVINRISIESNTGASILLQLVVKREGTSDMYNFIRQFAIVNNGGTTSIEGSVTTIGTDGGSSGLSTTSVSVTADNSNDAINISVTGLSGTDLQWSGKVELVISKD